jgi:salicylate hydroxylase
LAASNNPPHEHTAISWHDAQMKTDTIAIIGGGIAGLAAAIAVTKSGRAVSIYEKAEKFEPIGAGLQLGPNAVRALTELDAWDAVEPFTYAPPAIHMRDGRSGRLVREIRLGEHFEARFGQPYRVAHRADLHQALLQVATSSSSVHLQMGKEISRQDWPNAEPVIAADGIWSQSRELYFPGSPAIKVSDTIYRSLIPCPDVIGVDLDCVNLWLYPGGHVVHYPVGKDHKLNLVAITQGTLPPEHFVAAAPALLDILRQAPSWTNWPAAYVRPLRNWTAGHHSLLIGDAAHGTLPYLAQGAAMALEDAAALGRIFKTETTPESAFAELSKARLSRTKKLHAASLHTGRIYHANALISKVRNAVLQTIPGDLLLQQMAWIYKGQ